MKQGSFHSSPWNALVAERDGQLSQYSHKEFNHVHVFTVG